MLTRRTFYLAALSAGINVSKGARAQQSDVVEIRFRVDDSVRQSIPLMLQQKLKIEVDESQEA
jgi:hypothetical protein